MRAMAADSTKIGEVGTLAFLDNAVDSLTGTVTGSDADPSQLKALETMQRNHRIAERLARLKASSGAASGD